VPEALPPIFDGSTDPSGANAQAGLDPLQPTAADGWSPQHITPVRSRNEGGFIGSAVNFTLGGVQERPGQRLSTAQVDQLAPFYATQFGLDEGFVRQELAKVYVYIGGPAATSGQAMTIGHHIYVPDEQSLTRIMTPAGRRWLAHELSHTMQFLSYEHSSPQRFLADYITSLVVGKDPRQPGTGGGPAVWGSAFSALRTTGKSEDEIGRGATSLKDRFLGTVLPAAALSIPVAVTAGGAISAARATTGRQLLGTSRGVTLGMGVIAAPALSGALIGSAQDQIGTGWAQALGTIAGGSLAGLALWKSGAFQVGGSTALTEVGRTLGRTSAIGLAAAVTLGGAAIGFMSATASANSISGWSNSADVLRSLANRPSGEAPDTLTYQDAMHDGHWVEIDAEATARKFVREWQPRPAGSPPVQGRIPSAPDRLGEKIQADVSDRVDWGLKIPLLIGIPAAIGVGTGVLGARTGQTLLKATFEEGLTPIETLREAMRMIGSQSRGVGNSLGVGASVTVAPLVAGGLVGPLFYNATGSTTLARIGGAGTAAVTTGALLTMLLKGRGSSPLTLGLKVGAGMLAAAGVGFLSGGVATEALRPHEREYDIRGGASAAK
jgi:hypothetical protein